jgi:sulfate adenylyltransferase
VPSRATTEDPALSPHAPPTLPAPGTALGAEAPAIDLTASEVDEVELLADGLADGPLRLQVEGPAAEALGAGDLLGLRDPEGTLVGVLRITGLTQAPSPDATRGATCVWGDLAAFARPHHPSFRELRRPVDELRRWLAGGAGGHRTLVPTRRALHDADLSPLAALLRTDPDSRILVLALLPSDALDVRWAATIRALQVAAELLGGEVGADGTRVRVAVLPWPHRRELAEAAGGARTAGERDRIGRVAARLGASQVRWPTPAGDDVDTRLRTGLADDLPAATPPAVAAELAPAFPPRRQRGLVVLLTGLSGSGKSTIAQELRGRLLERGGRTVSLLDGDRVRKHLSRGLGFSTADREENVRRIGFVATEVARPGGVAICAPIAPHDLVRRDLRVAAEAAGAGFVLVHVATPLEECERRDRKGLYARARAGELRGLTGIDDPYEAPTDADIVLDTVGTDPATSAARILGHLRSEGWI